MDIQESKIYIILIIVEVILQTINFLLSWMSINLALVHLRLIRDCKITSTEQLPFHNSTNFLRVHYKASKPERHQISPKLGPAYNNII